MQKNNNKKVEALKKVILLERLGKKGKSAKILENQGIRIKYSEQVLDPLLLTKSAEYYRDIGWFKKANRLYIMMKKNVKGHNCLYKEGKIQKDIETIIDKKFANQLTGFSSTKNLLLQLKMKKEIAKKKKKQGYLGKAAEFLMEKIGLSFNELKQYLTEYCFHVTITR